jgi:DNA-binding MarR family transcriptional regulator
MTRLVDGLETRGWVSRQQSDEDGRRFVVSLTADGKKESTRLAKLTEKSIETILASVPEDDRDQVIRSLHLLREAAERTRSQLDCC